MKTLKASPRRCCKKLVAGLIEVLGDLVRRGLLLVGQLGHHAGALRVDGPADVAGRHVEELRGNLANLRPGRAPGR